MALPDPEAALAKSRGQDATEETKERLPPTELIDIDVTDSLGQRYTGRFLFTVPTIGQQVEIGKLKSIYLPTGSAADMTSATIVDVICFLTVCITFDASHKKPKWWNPLNGYTLDPYSDLYGRCLDYEARFHGKRADPGTDVEGVQGEDRHQGDDSLRVGVEDGPPAKRRETLAGDGA